MFLLRVAIPCLVCTSLTVGCLHSVIHAQVLTESNYDELVPAGKEVDAIYGDMALHDERVKAVVAEPLATRHANMTVRDIGGCLIDLATTAFASDQLSAFYPGRRAFPFSERRQDADSVTVVSPGNDRRPQFEVRYQLHPHQPLVEIVSTWTNTTAEDWSPTLQDDLRVDAGREQMRKSPNGTHDVFFIADLYWQQAYVIRADGYRIGSESNERESVLTYEPVDGATPVLKPGESFSLRRQMIVAKDLVEARAVADRVAGATNLQSCKLVLLDASNNPISNARVELSSDRQIRGIVRLDESGAADIYLPPANYSVTASVAGLDLLPAKSQIEVRQYANEFQLTSRHYQPGQVRARITDGAGQSIPAKVEFVGHDGALTPNWGPVSAEYFVRNLAYTEDGEFSIELQAGQYNVIVSHGPEYDAVFTRVQVEPGKTCDLIAQLNHAVQTPGWISSDFHSHSSPSGDNTGSQLGRVLNLAAEHIEFAPCTEHNRISTYEHHLARLELQNVLATATGIELTGSPLPLNHQNVFPLKHSPRTQDGGGPVTDVNPETQIERLTVWDDRSEKLVQQNHPDIGWLFFDRNGDGSPDEGYWRSFRLMDVMEIHPIDRILRLAPFVQRNGQPNANQRMFNWLQLLNQGSRIYGVVNTDAHYNFHGSGWLRNWIQVDNDDPATIDPLEIVRASEQGRLVMSNGPFLEAEFRSGDVQEPVVSGQDLAASDGRVTIDVRVQCPNWFDIDTVLVLVNGKPVDDLVFTRADQAEMFADGVVKFDQTLELELTEDSHLIVVAGNRTTRLGDVMGPTGGNQFPAALTNPVFVDIDGNGFVPNKDTLGHPLPVRFDANR